MVETLLRAKKFDVVRKAVKGSDGRDHAFEYVVHPGAVVILPLLDADQCVMIRNYRPTIERELWELPAGTLDVPGEPLDVAANRELEEETGYRAKQMERLCAFYSSPGFLDELLHAYVARDLIPTTQRLEPLERIRVETVRLDRAIEMIRDGRIVDSKTIVALLRWDMERKERE